MDLFVGELWTGLTAMGIKHNLVSELAMAAHKNPHIAELHLKVQSS